MTALLAHASAEDHAKYLAGNTLVCSDNLDILKALPDSSIDLIYLDPPFQSDTHYVAIFGDKGQVDQQLKDIWKWTTETENIFTRRIPRGGPGGSLLNALEGIRLQTGRTSPMAAYCVFMGRRLLEMRRVLKSTGSIYLHCDYHAGHFLRILLDAIFGAQNLIDVIAWNYGTPSGGRTSGKKPVKAHDTLLVYAKRYGQHTYNRQYTPYNEKYVKNWFRHVDEDGRHYQTRSRKGKIVRQYLDQSPGVPLSNVWSDIMQLYGQQGWFPTKQVERIGYPTQKPLALLERIVSASSNTGDLVFDPFCGCGTAVDAAAKLGRKYLGVDISAIAVRVMEQRLISRGETASPSVYGLDWSEYDWQEFERRALMQRDDAEDSVPGWQWAEDKVAGLLNAVPNSKKTGDGGVDARYYGAAGEEIPIQVKMHRRPVGRPDMDKLLGAQTAMKNRGIHAPMSLMVSLYPPPHNLRTFAAQQGRVEINGEEYPVMQALSVEEMLTKGERPKLPPVDPRVLVGDTQTRLVAVG